MKKANVSKITARTSADTRGLNCLVHHIESLQFTCLSPSAVWAWAKDQNYFLARVKYVYSY